MKLLVTGGSTSAPIDRVRQISNVFTGRTGASIAAYAYRQGHDVTLLTSNPESLGSLIPHETGDRWRTLRFHTFDDLMQAMETEIRSAPPDAIIHSAAVSDYRVAGIYAPSPDVSARVEGDSLFLSTPDGAPSRMVNMAAGKVKSSAPEIWLRLTPAPKIIDRIRDPWGFRGILIKFKLEVGVDEADLLEIAEASRLHSRADLMVANALETAPYQAYIGTGPDGYTRVPRSELPARLLERITSLVRSTL